MVYMQTPLTDAAECSMLQPDAHLQTELPQPFMAALKRTRQPDAALHKGKQETLMGLFPIQQSILFTVA